MSQDKELMEKLGRWAAEGKQKLEDFLEPENTEGHDDERTLYEKLALRAKEVENRLEQKLEEASIKIYQKMHIAHLKDLEVLQAEVDQLKAEIAALKNSKS